MRQEVISSGKRSFKIEVPYRLIDSGRRGGKPLLVYLHGFKQTIGEFEDRLDQLKMFNAYHLFIQGPYPVIERPGGKSVEEWGRSWYLYDGSQDQFLKSLELSSEFIQEVIDGLLNHLEVTRIGMVGYSMGAYLAGYFALSRRRHITDLVMIGGRLKTEYFEQQEPDYSNLNALALHGSRDRRVEAAPQRDCMEQLGDWGANVKFQILDADHEMDTIYSEEAIKWLRSNGYEMAS